MVDLDRRFNLSVYESYSGHRIEHPSQLEAEIYKEIRHPLYNVDQFSLEPIMYSYFSSMHYSLDDADEDAVLYLPVFLGLIGLVGREDTSNSLFRESVDLIKSIASSQPNRTFLLPLGRIYRYFHVWPWTIEFPENVIVLSIERYLPNKNVICVPYPSNTNYLHEGELAEQALAQLQAPKTRKACFFGRKRRQDHVRTDIISLFEQSAAVESVTNFASSGRMHLLADQAAIELSELRRRTWLSMEPPGDSPSRKGIFDALLSFSIPVLFYSGRYDHPFSRVFPWDETCVFINGSEEWRLLNQRITLDQLLEGVTQQDIEQKVNRLSSCAMLLQYTRPSVRQSTARDAFHAIDIEIASLLTLRKLHNSAH